MTLCIAAICGDDQSFGLRNCVAVCFDHKIEIPIASAETGFKFDLLSNAWCVLASGPIPQTEELKDIFREHLKTTNISEANVLEELRIPTYDFRRRIAERYVQSSLAVNYKDFLDNGKGWLPEDSHRQLVSDITAQMSQEHYVNMELILIGLVGGRFHLFQYSRHDVDECLDFSVIGSGSQTAQPNLYRREIWRSSSIASATYAIYEAKKLSEHAPGVGKETTIMLLVTKDGGRIAFRHISEKGWKTLNGQFRKFAPKAFSDKNRPEEYFDEAIG